MVIDHHATNEGFGEVNWIDGKAPASAVLIYRLYQALDMPISKDAALCLYTGLSTDTGNFIYAKIEAKSRKTDPFMALVAGMVAEQALGTGAPIKPPPVGAVGF
jgi:nanoRNase/pAp phosphatase (c-di-AMP/oligoRNAs hydrolase)